MESNANLNGNPSSSRNPFPQNGFNLLLNGGLHKKIPILDRLSLNLSSNPGSIYDSFDEFQDSRNVEESNTSNPSNLDASNNDTIQECQQVPLLNLFPQTPNDLLPNGVNMHEADSESNERDNGKKHVERGSTCSKIRKPTVKARWTLEEDSKLMELVERYGNKRWSGIAIMLGGRLGKQCRERWENYLKDNLKKKEFWTEEEKIQVMEAHKQVGSRWAELAKRIPGRSQNSIKNLWNGTKRRLQNALRKGRISRELTPFERYIINTLRTNEEPPVNSTQVDCQLLDLNLEPVETSDQMIQMIRSSGSNNREANSGVGGEMEMEEEHEEEEEEEEDDSAEKDGRGDEVEDVYHPVFDDKLFGSNDRAAGMSEDAHKEMDFMELLLNS